ncbi:MAG TPA: zf-HC2 domain-containing protein [Rubrobacteraceae bacterium]|nr:zf-HC2 domain-containing protein [Rubrobacteraceae bacterium]
MSEPREPGERRCCNPEAIFELVEGVLGPEREREVRSHLDACPGCRESYEKELSLNASLSALELAEPPCRSVCRGVAMALPTRPLKARLMWSVLSLTLLAAAVLALSLDGTIPADLAVEAVDIMWGLVSGFADVTRAILSAVGPTLLIALAVGAVVDLCIAAAVLLVKSRSVRQA